MSKPVDLPRWGETVGGLVATDVTEPTSGDKDSGFVPGSPSNASYMNWLINTAYQWIKYLDAGDLLHADRVIQLPASLAQASFDCSSMNLQGTTWIFGSTSRRLYLPVALRRGDRIKSVKAFSTNAAAAAVTFHLYAQPLTGASATLIDTFSTAASSGAQSATSSALTRTVAADESFFLEIEPATIGDEFFGAELTYDRPA